MFRNTNKHSAWLSTMSCFAIIITLTFYLLLNFVMIACVPKYSVLAKFIRGKHGWVAVSFSVAHYSSNCPCLLFCIREFSVWFRAWKSAV